MISRRWLSAAAVTAVALAVLGAGGDALASNAAATSQIKACYQKGATLPPLDHVTSGACPAGDASLTWNKTGPRGPQGPAGLSTGSSGTTATSVILNQPSTLEPVLNAAAAPASGTYYVNASVMVIVAQGDTVACLLGENGQGVGAFATVGPVANQTYETLPLSGMMSLTAGTAPQVLCSGYNANSSTSFYDGGITSVLINSPTGNTAPATPAQHALPPHL